MFREAPFALLYCSSQSFLVWGGAHLSVCEQASWRQLKPVDGAGCFWALQVAEVQSPEAPAIGSDLQLCSPHQPFGSSLPHYVEL